MAPDIRHRFQPRNARAFKSARERRLALLPQFEQGDEVSYTWDNSSLGKVAGHDLRIGRVITDINGSHDPGDLKVLSRAKA